MSSMVYMFRELIKQPLFIFIKKKKRNTHFTKFVRKIKQKNIYIVLI